jgi:acetylornithine/succinyldiaminopimelate/putrescine aminotransferase
VFKVIEEENLLERARFLGARLAQGLAALSDTYEWVVGVRGTGFIVGLELSRDALPLQKILEEKGLLSLATANTVIRLVPPMTVSEQEIDEAVSRIHDACAAFQEVSEESKI